MRVAPRYAELTPASEWGSDKTGLETGLHVQGNDPR